jgi:hypothetical protein
MNKQKVKQKMVWQIKEKWAVFAVTLMTAPFFTEVAMAAEGGGAGSGKLITVPAVENIGATLIALMSSGGTLAGVLTGACLVSGGIGYVMDRSIKGLLLGALAGVVVTGGLSALALK